MDTATPAPRPDDQAAADHATDVAIIGAGPVGLFAVFQFGMLGMATHVIDALDAVGGQCVALYPEKPIYDIPGYPRIDAGRLVEELAAQAAPFAPVYHLGRQVEGLAALEDGGFVLTTSKGTTIVARAVVIAAGVGAFGPNRPPIPGIEAFEGRSVHYMVARRDQFRGKRLVIAGGGDSALDWAINLSEIAESIAVVHRRDRFRGAPESVARLKTLAEEGRVELIIPYQLDSLEGADGVLDAVIVRTLEGEARRLPADALLAFFGLSQNLGPIASWGLNLDHNHVAIDQSTAETSIPGVYAVGDIAAYPHKLKLILTGFAEAASAAHHAYARVFPGKALHFEYSTTKGVPGAG